MRTTFIESLCTLAEKDERIWLLTGDLGYSVLERFADRFPGRYVNIGVAEQNMAGIAAGLALCGKKVFIYSIANFPVMRCLEQIRNDICYHNLDVKIVSVGGGFSYGSAGYTHHGVEDLAVMGAMPNMKVIVPGDPVEVRMATRAVAECPGPCFLRLGKGGEAIIHGAIADFPIDKAIWLCRGENACIIASGAILGEAVQAAQLLEAKGVKASLVSIPTISPIDEGTIGEIARSHKLIVTVEEHSCRGGLGDAVARIVASGFRQCLLLQVGICNTGSATVGSHSYLRDENLLSGSHIADAVTGALRKLMRTPGKDR
ncbi:MAG: transketolase C-terminal domain-containing protein [Smithellaceae bacterium]|nr:transketolase C-terminal domain-containing protein [Smithellaceae bacterium]